MMTTTSDTILQDMVHAIVQEVDPERIILFDSQARGNANADSDFDLLIVEKEPFGKQRSKWKELSKIRRALLDVPYALDLFVSSESEIQEWKDSSFHIIAQILREGQVVYERA